MLRDMTGIRPHWSEEDDRAMVEARRFAQILNDLGCAASVGRGEFDAPVVRVQCGQCGQWFEPSFDLPGTYICDSCY